MELRKLGDVRLKLTFTWIPPPSPGDGVQVLDDGHLTDSQGRKVDFRNTLIVMTSNCGAEALATLPEGAPSEQARDEVMSAVRARFQPEFLNRIDETVLFDRLSRDNMRSIVDIQLVDVERLLRERHVGLEVTDEARVLLANEGCVAWLCARVRACVCVCLCARVLLWPCVENVC